MESTLQIMPVQRTSRNFGKFAEDATIVVEEPVVKSSVSQSRCGQLVCICSVGVWRYLETDILIVPTPFLYVVANYREQVGKIKFISIMKTLRLIGTTLLMVVLCLNFTACCDDDDDIDVSQLERTWGLVRSAGWESCNEETEREEWDYTCDPYNPGNDRECEKLVIKKLADNSYSVTAYYYSDYNSQWQMDGSSQTLTLNGNTLTVSKTNGEYGYFDSYAILIIEVLTADKLALRIKYDNVQTSQPTDLDYNPNHRDSADFTETFTRMEQSLLINKGSI